MSLRVLHVLDHSLPLHSGYTFRTLSILREQRTLGWETEHLTTPKQGVSPLAREEVDVFTGGAISRDNIGAQKKAMTTAEGPVFAYCASGNRSSIVWALAQAGDVCADELIAAAARWGYDLEPFRAALAAPIG